MKESDLLIVGLGNPGPDYEGTRHNLGWECVHELAERLGVEVVRKRWRSMVGSFQRDTRRIWLAWPQTYMNLSGRAVAEALRDLQLPTEQVWVVYDEIDLPLCRLRIRIGGATAGHNGVTSILDHLRTDRFVRFRIGVGRPNGDGVRHVLGRWGKQEASALEEVRKGVADALELALEAGVARAMEVYNRRGSLGCQEVQ
jgi:PTH1 family peptidyl-tRNA hydrolase